MVSCCFRSASLVVSWWFVGTFAVVSWMVSWFLVVSRWCLGGFLVVSWIVSRWCLGGDCPCQDNTINTTMWSHGGDSSIYTVVSSTLHHGTLHHFKNGFIINTWLFTNQDNTMGLLTLTGGKAPSGSWQLSWAGRFTVSGWGHSSVSVVSWWKSRWCLGDFLVVSVVVPRWCLAW